jgi:riboflavin synthase
VFTGLVEDLGRIESTSDLAAGRRLSIATGLPTAELTLGESVCVSGACMTVVETSTSGSSFAVEVSAESLRKTTLGALRSGDRVNLERSLRLSDRIGGHLVSGHVDGVGKLATIADEGESAVYSFELPSGLGRLLVEKGSVAVDGVSLTCFNCKGDRFDVAVIRHTREVTTLGTLRAGSHVNIETDMLGKYVSRLLEPQLAARKSG